MFKKKLKDTKIKFGSRGILDEAMAIFKRLFFEPETVEPVRDGYGTIAMDIGKFLLVSKEKPYGDIVSVSRQIWDQALEENKKIIMYIQLQGYFYRFDPAEITDYKLNWRGKSQMVNFGIKEGVNLMKLKAKKERINFIVLKNKVKYIKEEEELKRLSKEGVFG